MTFTHPLALALLAAVPLAWWLHRSRRGAPVVRVASLLAFAGAAATTPSAAPRRTVDPRLVSILAAMTLLALAASGPTFGGTSPAAFRVVVDRSVSATARTCDASSRAEALLREVAPGAVPDFRSLRSDDGTDGLPASLAPLLASAREEGFPGIVLVTDADVAPLAGVAVVGPSAGATANVSVASAALDGDEAVVAVRNHGGSDVAVRLVCADVGRDVNVAAGGIGTARFAAPDRGEMATFAIASPPDDLAADDRLVAARRGGARRVRFATTAPCPHLSEALRAAGVEIVRGEAAADVVVEYGDSSGTATVAMRRLVVAPGRGAVAGAVTLRGDAIVGRGEFADALPAPGTTLVIRGQHLGGEPVWTGGERVLAAWQEESTLLEAVFLDVDPEDPRSDWHRDPSFPAFVAAALDRLTDGPDRLVPSNAVPASESDVVHAPPRTSTPQVIRAVLRPAGPAPGAVRPARWLAAAAAALLAAASLVRRS